MRGAKAWGLIGIGTLCLMIPHLILWISGMISARAFAGVAVAVVGAIHVYFGLLEGTQWDRAAGLQIHGLGQDVAERTRQVGRNMGLYNLIFAVLLVGTFSLGRLDAYRAQVVLLGLIVAAGFFGTLTIGSPKIVIVQSLPAALALAAVLIGRPGTLTEEQATDRIIKVEKNLLTLKTEGRAEDEKESKHSGRDGASAAPTAEGKAAMLRGQHPKSVGFVVADFVVNKDLSEDLRAGVFRQPGTRYGAVVRFSNARVMNDSEKGGHGMSIKLFGVEGEKLMPDASETNTQDFLLFDNPVFFIRDAFEYLDFEDAELLSTNKRGDTSKLLLALLFPRPRSLTILTTQAQAKPSIDPLGANYWSVVPYRLGHRAVKFRVTPDHAGKAIPGPSENSINEALQASLRSPPAGGWKFAFEAQIQTDPDLMPIEDPTIDWGRKFVKLATIAIRPEASRERFGKDLGLNWPPPSKGDSEKDDAREARSEHLSFSPWHGLVEHEPLGGINRVRRRVYKELSALRNADKGEPERVEPSPP